MTFYNITLTDREIGIIIKALDDYGIKLYKPIEEKRRITAKDLKPSEELQHIINKFVELGEA